MTAELPGKSTLELIEDGYYDQLMTTEDPRHTADALTGLGLVHLSMELPKVPQGLREIWSGMHGRTVIENLGTVGIVLGTIFNYGSNQLTQEYAASKQNHSK